MTGDPYSHEPGYYPPPSSGPYPPQYSPPPKKKSKAPWIVLGIALGFVILVIGACAAGIFFLAQDETVREAFSDLTIDFSDGVPPTGPVSCEVTGVDAYDDYRVFVTATNASGEPSAYRIDYKLVGPDGLSRGTDFGIIGRVEPGETVDDDALGTISANDDWTEVDCQVTDALRVPAD